MTGKSFRHITHYAVMLFIMIAGIVSIVFTGRNLSTQTGIIVMLALSYLIWGIVHHSLENTLHSEVVIEYLLLAVLGAGCVLSVLYYL